jgi:hypothetical protein
MRYETIVKKGTAVFRPILTTHSHFGGTIFHRKLFYTSKMKSYIVNKNTCHKLQKQEEIKN